MPWQEIYQQAAVRPSPLSVQEIGRRKEDHKNWLAISAFEGIYPDADMLADDELLVTGKMNVDEYRSYLISKIEEHYHCKYQS